MGYGSLDHPILLEWVGHQFDFGLMAGIDETGINIRYRNLGLHRFVLGNQRKQYCSRLDNGSSRVSSKILNHTILRG